MTDQELIRKFFVFWGVSTIVASFIALLSATAVPGAVGATALSIGLFIIGIIALLIGFFLLFAAWSIPKDHP